MASYRRVFWSLVLPIAIATYLIASKCISSLGKGISDAEIKSLTFPDFATQCTPEPAEQLAYVLAILLPVALVFTGTVLLRAVGVFSRPEPSNPWMGLFALFSQLCLLGFGAKALVYQVTIVHRYSFLESSSLLLAVIALGLGLTCANRATRVASSSHAALEIVRRQTWFPRGLGILWAVAFAITGVYKPGELRFTTEVFQFHLPYTMAEYAAVVNGRIPMVDFVTQYHNLQNLISIPIFRLFGFDLGTFSAVMFFFSASVLLLVFATLNKICRSAWTALFLFVPLVALAFYPEDTTASGYSSNAFNYYAVGPIRYLGPAVLAWLAAWYLERPTVPRLLVTAPIASLVALNNLDFGMPAAVGMLACSLLFPPQFARAGLARRIVGAATLFLLIALATLGLFCLSIRVAVGTWPMLDQLLVFPRTFAYIGYFMLPMPQMGMHLVVYLTSVSAVLIAIYETFSAVHQEIAQDRRVINGSLAYAGIASFGPLVYYVGRSHFAVLEATFLIWAFVSAQLLHRAWRNWRDVAKMAQTPDDFLLPIPTVAIACLYVLFVPMVLEVPNPKAQASRLSASYPSTEATDAAAVRLIKQYVRAGSRTVIAYPNGHWLALRAGVVNGFPYAHDGSVILRDQLNGIMAALAGLPIKQQYFFGNPRPELRERIEEQGYTLVDAVGDFAFWARTAK